MPRGGYQAPAKPASVSGPGSLSKRTDGGPTQPIRAVPGLPYGQGQEVIDQQRQAPLPQVPGPTGSPTAPQPQQQPSTPPQPLSAGSIMPDQPVTAGAAMGSGPGPNVITPNPSGQYQSVHDYLTNLAQTSGNPDIAFLAGLGKA